MELFVLGAGFSRSFVETAPLLTSFVAGHECLLESEEFQAARRFVSECRFTISTANIETLMTLAERHDRDAFEQLTNLMVKVFDKSFDKEELRKERNTRYRFKVRHPETLKAFARYLVARSPRAQVITLNYDVLLENYLELEEVDKKSPHRFHSGRSYGFHANTWKRDGSGIRWQSEKERKEHLLVLKLHGSANWLVLANLKFAHRVVIISAHERNLEERYIEAAKFISDHRKPLPLMIPPVLDKGHDLAHCALAQVWARAANSIQKARRMVFVGYSFPATDFHVEYLFRVNRRDPCQVEVVDNVSCEGDKQRLRKRYEDVFGENVRFHWGDAAEELKKLIERTNVPGLFT